MNDAYFLFLLYLKKQHLANLYELRKDVLVIKRRENSCASYDMQQEMECRCIHPPDCF